MPNHDKTQDILTRAIQLELAYSRAKHAEEWVNEKNIEDAFYCWGKIFGSYFPTYQ